MAATPLTDWIQREIAERRAERSDCPPAALLPPDAFSDQPAGAAAFRRLCEPATPCGRNAWAIHRRIMSSCAGWAQRPTADEFYEAVRARTPSDRQKTIIRMWGAEATVAEIIEAWVQRAYTWRELVAALHRAQFTYGPRIRIINRWAQKS